MVGFSEACVATAEMAQVKKLQLQGIRSFGPEENDRQSVEFFSPLTLILGQVLQSGGQAYFHHIPFLMPIYYCY
jgi:hypothetical protein